LVLLAAVFAQGQLQYEQAAYTDAAAPAPLEDAQPVEADVSEVEAQEESSFAESDAEAMPGTFSKLAHKQQRAVNRVKQLFNKRKDGGGNISPSKGVVFRPSKPRRPRPSVKAVNEKLSKRRNKRVKRARVPSARPSLKAPIIDAKAGKKHKKHNKRKPKRFGGKKFVGRRNRRGLRVPKAPAAARGPVDNLWHSERFVPKDSENRDPEMAKLNLALEAVKEDILSTNKQINDERRWVIAVGKIIKSYNTKMARVEAHIIALRKEMKMLYRKKKQIENLKLQKALEAKLKEAKAELKTLRNSLKHVAVKQKDLNKSGADLRATIAGIQGQLAKLRGQHMYKKCPKGKKYSKKAKRCTSICKAGAKFNKKTKKCVSRCGKGKKWSKKGKKCIKKGKGKGKGKRRGARKF